MGGIEKGKRMGQSNVGGVFMHELHSSQEVLTVKIVKCRN